MDRRPPGPSAAGRWMAASVAAAVLVLGVTSCADDDEAKGPTATVGSSPPTTEPALTTTTVDDVKADVEAAQMAATAAYYDVLEEPDPTDERLKIHRSGESLTQVRATVQGLVDRREAARYGDGGPPTGKVEAVELSSGTEAAVVTCTVDRSKLISVTTGEVINDELASSRQRYVLRLQGGTWNVVSTELLDRFPGSDRCE